MQRRAKIITGQHVGYIRVSSIDQNTGRQLESLDLDRTFVDQISGKDTKRPALTECLAYLRQGDTLHVHSIDRLCRNLADLLRVVTELRQKGIAIRFHSENLDFGCGESNATSELMLAMLGAVAQFERTLIKERQREGIALAKAKGTKLGRPKITPEKAEAIHQMLKDGKSKAEIALKLGISRATVYNIHSKLLK